MSLEEKSLKTYLEIGDERIPEIVSKYFGKDAQLESWSFNSFMDPGENYLGRILAVTCVITRLGDKQEGKFIAKLNPRRSLKLFQEMTQSFFIKEGRFFNEVAPKLNNILKAAQISPLKIPKCYYVDLAPNDEIVLLQDLRIEGFKCANRLVPLNVNQLFLSLEELAKLHASSHIFISKQSEEQLQELSYMKDLWLHEENPGADQYISYCSARFNGILNAMKTIKGYEKVQKWLEREEDNLFHYFVQQWEKTESKFRVICHGDVWTNNILLNFTETKPADTAVLIDFQQCRIASLITDIYILLITSADGTTRKTKINVLLQSYYNNFKAIFDKAEIEMPFTFEELLEEYKAKIPFGFLCGIIRLPLILAVTDEVYDFDGLNENSFAKFIQIQNFLSQNAIKIPGDRRERVLSIFDSAIENNLFE